MGDLFWNKIAGAVLVLVLGIIAINELSHSLVHPHPAEQLAYPVDISTSAGGSGGEAEEEVVVDYGLLLAAADVGAGERVTAQCVQCHTFDQGGGNGTGPGLWNVVNRDVASVDGFGYSRVLGEVEGSWSYEQLDGFLTNPARYARGTTMSYRGIRDEAQRMNVIAYLRSLSDDPAPLPEPLPAAE